MNGRKFFSDRSNAEKSNSSFIFCFSTGHWRDDDRGHKPYEPVKFLNECKNRIAKMEQDMVCRTLDDVENTTPMRNRWTFIGCSYIVEVALPLEQTLKLMRDNDVEGLASKICRVHATSGMRNFHPYEEFFKAVDVKYDNGVFSKVDPAPAPGLK